MKKICSILALMMCVCISMNAQEFSKTLASYDGTTYFYSIWGTAGTVYPNDLVIPDSLPTSEMTGGITKLPVKQIADNAFQSFPITSVKIPAPMEIIGANAFNRCTNLRRMYIYADYTKLTLGGSSALTFNNDFAALYVPKESVTSFEYGFAPFFPGGIFPIEEGAVSVTATSETTADYKVEIVWFLKKGVTKYVLTVYDENMAPFATKTFDANGIEKNGGSSVPARQLETTSTMGVGVASIGPLGNKKKYSYEIKGTDAEDNELMFTKGSFSLDLSDGKPSIAQKHNEELFTDIEETRLTEQSARKVMRGGVVYIEKDGQLLNLLGQEVRL